MTSNKEMVGEWISIRRDELGINKTDMAKLVGADVTSVSNAESGKHEIKRNRAVWEDALRWERGDLTRAYRHGEEPRPITPETRAQRMPDPELIARLKELLAMLSTDDDVVLAKMVDVVLARLDERGDEQPRKGAI